MRIRGARKFLTEKVRNSSAPSSRRGSVRDLSARRWDRSFVPAMGSYPVSVWSPPPPPGEIRLYSFFVGHEADLSTISKSFCGATSGTTKMSIGPGHPVSEVPGRFLCECRGWIDTTRFGPAHCPACRKRTEASRVFCRTTPTFSEREKPGTSPSGWLS